VEQATTDLDKLVKVQAIFERFRRDMQNDRDQMGATQAFKMCYELALRVMKVALIAQGVEVTSPKDIFRKASLAKLIDDINAWFNFQEKRNLTAYAYEQENLTAIVESFDLFSRELDKLIQTASK
jgi:nucleotidyltransferase substrate binding protein (TIGR01987 family)